MEFDTPIAHRLSNPIPAAIPPMAGIGLKAQHYGEIAERLPAELGWLEVHSENYFGDGGEALNWLDRLRADFPVSLHGVGLSLGSANDLNTHHLDRLARLKGRIEPGQVSEHLSWSTANGDYLNDLIPLPYTEEALEIFTCHVEQMQDALGRRVLIENPSAYLRYEHSTIPETEFLLAVVERSGCGILLDVNNVCVSAHNLDFDALKYIHAIPGHLVDEIHLAGHFDAVVDNEILKIDDHGSPVRDRVWDLYAQTIARFGAKPTLIEWDTDVPNLDILLNEARRANAIIDAITRKSVHAYAR